MTNRLSWHIGDNLRWLADNPGAPRLPCGWLTGLFLNTVAKRFDTTPDRSGEADKTGTGLAEGESGLPEGSSKPCP